MPGYRDVPTWACGPAPLDRGRPRGVRGLAGSTSNSALRVEYFKPPSVRVSTGSTTDVAEGDITFGRTGTTVANTGATLLEQAEAAGLTPAFGCRMGICFSCTATKKARARSATC